MSLSSNLMGGYLPRKPVVGIACRSPLQPLNQNRPLAPLASTPRPTVVCVGEGLFDCIADQPGLPREEVESWTPYPGGAPCNVACGLGQLGISTAFFSALGKDDMGDKLVAMLSSRGVDLSALARVEQPTRDVYVVRDEEGDREFSGFGRPSDEYCDCFLDPEAIPEAQIRTAEVVVMGTLGLAYPVTGETLRRVADITRGCDAKLLIDVNWRPVFFKDPDAASRPIRELVEKADLVKITDEEAEWLLGINAVDALEDPCRVAKEFENAQGVLVTAGSLGASYCFTAEDGTTSSGFVPVYELDVVDTTGAGDAFTAGFLAYVLDNGGLDCVIESKKSLGEAVKFGAACGALTTKAAGGIAPQPKFQEIVDLVKTVSPGE